MALVSAVVLTERFNRKLTILWSTGRSDCLATLQDLIDLSTLEGLEVIDPQDHDVSWPEANMIPTARLREMLEGAEERVQLRAHVFYGADTMPPSEFSAGVHRVMRQLRPSAEVMTLVGSGQSPEIGIHARLTDHLTCQICTPKWCYRSALALVGQSMPGTKVLICSDNASFAAELARTRGIVAQMQPSLRYAAEVDRFSRLGVQLAMADLWQLSQCPVILASPWSTFAVTASGLGGGVMHNLVSSQRLNSPGNRRWMWKLTIKIRYSPQRRKWHLPGDLSLREPRRCAVTFAALLLARFACSPVYQDRAVPRQNRRFLSRFSSSFLGQQNDGGAVAGDDSIAARPGR